MHPTDIVNLGDYDEELNINDNDYTHCHRIVENHSYNSLIINRPY